MFIITPKLLQRFWSKVEKSGNCWVWIAHKNKDGYGQFWAEKLELAHRVSYQIHNKTITNNLTIDHLCRNRACVNPDHLELVSQKINVLRGNSIASQNIKKTHCPQGHSYTGDNLYIQPQTNWRSCKTCKNKRITE